MTVTSGFFNSINGDRRYLAKHFSDYFASFIGNGVFPNPSTGLQVVERVNMAITIKPGKGWINGYFVTNDDDLVFTLDNSDGSLNRIDRVILKLNFMNREITIEIKKGTLASSPVAPTLQRDADIYELALADIRVNAGVAAITQANITDQRFNSNVCGIVAGLLDQIDTTDLFVQYDAEFNEWFETIQGVLDGDVAGNLANLIANNKAEFDQFRKDTEILYWMGAV